MVSKQERFNMKQKHSRFGFFVTAAWCVLLLLCSAVVPTSQGAALTVSTDVDVINGAGVKQTMQDTNTTEQAFYGIKITVE
jgi:hypothetical protein